MRIGRGATLILDIRRQNDGIKGQVTCETCNLAYMRYYTVSDYELHR